MEQWCLFLTRFQICLVATHGSASFLFYFFLLPKKKHLLLKRCNGQNEIARPEEEEKVYSVFSVGPRTRKLKTETFGTRNDMKVFWHMRGETLLITLKRHCLSVCFVALIIHLLWTWYIFFFSLQIQNRLRSSNASLLCLLHQQKYSVFKVKSGRNWQLDKLSDWVSFSMGYS